MMSLFTRHGQVRAQPQIPWKRESAPRVSSVVVGCPKRRPLMEEIRPRILRGNRRKRSRALSKVEGVGDVVGAHVGGSEAAQRPRRFDELHKAAELVLGVRDVPF